MSVTIKDANNNSVTVSSINHGYQLEIIVNVHGKRSITYYTISQNDKYFNNHCMTRLAEFYSHIFTNVDVNQLPANNLRTYCVSKTVKNADELFYLLFYEKAYNLPSNFNSYILKAPKLYADIMSRNITTIEECVVCLSGQLMLFEDNAIFAKTLQQSVAYNNLRTINSKNIDIIKKLFNIISHEKELTDNELNSKINDYECVSDNYLKTKYPIEMGTKIFKLPLNTTKFINYMKNITVNDFIKVYAYNIEGKSAYRAIEQCNEIIHKNNNKLEEHLNEALLVYAKLVDMYANPDDVNLLLFCNYHLLNNYKSTNTIQLIKDYIMSNPRNVDEIFNVFHYVLNNKGYTMRWINDFDYINILIGEMQKAGLTTDEILTTFAQVKDDPDGRLTVRQWKTYLKDIDYYKEFPYSWWKTFVR